GLRVRNFPCHTQGTDVGRGPAHLPLPSPTSQLGSLRRSTTMRRITRFACLTAALTAALPPAALAPQAHGAVTREQVENAIQKGIHYLKSTQRGDGSWVEADAEHRGTTSLVVIALLTAGEPVNSPTITRALDHLRKFTPEQLKSTYAVALQTMAFAAATPES